MHPVVNQRHRQAQIVVSFGKTSRVPRVRDSRNCHDLDGRIATKVEETAVIPSVSGLFTDRNSPTESLCFILFFQISLYAGFMGITHRILEGSVICKYTLCSSCCGRRVHEV